MKCSSDEKKDTIALYKFVRDLVHKIETEYTDNIVAYQDLLLE